MQNGICITNGMNKAKLKFKSIVLKSILDVYYWLAEIYLEQEDIDSAETTIMLSMGKFHQTKIYQRKKFLLIFAGEAARTKK
jgi:hypothetical protein